MKDIIKKRIYPKMSKLKEHLNESRKYNLEDVADVISNEGLGYAIQNYLSWKDIEDKQLAKLWKQAADAMDKIEEITKEYLDY